MHSSTMKLTEGEMKTSITAMISLLKDPKHLDTLDDAKQAVVVLQEVR